MKPNVLRPSAMKDAAEGLLLVARGIDAGPIRHDRGRRLARVLSFMGVHLVSRRRLGLEGHVLKAGAKPVMEAWYGSPIRKWVPLYVMGLQTRPKGKAKPPRDPKQLSLAKLWEARDAAI